MGPTRVDLSAAGVLIDADQIPCCDPSPIDNVRGLAHRGSLARHVHRHHHRHRRAGRARGRALHDPLRLSGRRASRIGASIACDGACLTATEVAPAGSGSVFTVDVSNETLSKTTLGDWQPGQRINLERALKAGDELGGHIVSGHVDGVARIVDIRPDGNSRRFTFEAPARSCPLHRPQGLGGARRHLAHRQRGGARPLRHQRHPPHLDPHDLGAPKSPATGSTWRSTCLPATSRAPWSSAREGRLEDGRHTRKARASSRPSTRSSRTCATGA